MFEGITSWVLLHSSPLHSVSSSLDPQFTLSHLYSMSFCKWLFSMLSKLLLQSYLSFFPHHLLVLKLVLSLLVPGQHMEQTKVISLD